MYAFLCALRLVTRVAADFVVLLAPLEAAAFGEIFFSATWFTSLTRSSPFWGLRDRAPSSWLRHLIDVSLVT